MLCDPYRQPFLMRKLKLLYLLIYEYVSTRGSFTVLIWLQTFHRVFGTGDYAGNCL